MGILLHSCVEVHEPIELSFGVVIGVSRGLGVLDHVHMPKGKGQFRGFYPRCFQLCNCLTEMYSTRA